MIHETDSSRDRVFRYVAVFCGSGGQSIGYNKARVRVLGVDARWDCQAAIDNDPIACADYERFTGHRPICADVMEMEQRYTPASFRAEIGEDAPDAVLISAPCKGGSRLLSAKKAKTRKYRLLNRLATVFCGMMLDAWKAAPPKLVLFENVPGLPSRARAALRSLRSLLRSAGYRFDERTHDCGELGGLAQHRKRYLLVARHVGRCPPSLYQAPKKRVRGIGEVLAALPMPATAGADRWGTLHTMPRLSWRNWLRLACIPAGGDWRDLAGVLEERERREVFRRHAVAEWDQPIEAVTGPGGHTIGAVADPRWHNGAYGVRAFDEPAATVTSADHPSKGRFGVADPRIGLSDAPGRHDHKYAVRSWDQPAKSVIGKTQPGSGAQAVADPRGLLPTDPPYDAAYGVLGWKSPARAIAGMVAAGTGAYAVADPRALGFLANVRILTLDEAMALDLDPSKPPPFVPVIVAGDGTWHRPLTLLELAVLQSYPAELDGQPIRFEGTRTQVSGHIGNSIPPDAAEAMAIEFAITLVHAELEAFAMSSTPVWVSPPTARVQ